MTPTGTTLTETIPLALIKTEKPATDQAARKFDQ